MSVTLKGQDTQANLILLDMLDFYTILGMDGWLLTMWF